MIIMTLEEVIKRGEDIPSPLAVFSQNNMDIFLLIVISIVVFGILFLVIKRVVKQPNIRVFATGGVFIAVIVVLILNVINTVNAQSENAAANKQAFYDWMMNDVAAYAETQEHIDRELVSIEYVKDPEGENVPVVKYTGDAGITETLDQNTMLNTAVKLVYDVPEDAPEFVRFYEIKHDLGNGITPGEYGLTVHLHEQEE